MYVTAVLCALRSCNHFIKHFSTEVSTPILVETIFDMSGLTVHCKFNFRSESH